MTPNVKRVLPGIDVLKFFLAILIVAGHCSLFEELPDVFVLQNRLNSIAVPIFFATSAYLFFRKLQSTPNDNISDVLQHTIKRQAVLFLFWYILMLPMTYVKWFSIATLKETFFAILLSCTFRGYWFIKALLINTVIVYLCKGTRSLWICTLIALVVYLFFSYNYIYSYYPAGLALRPYYSFYYHTLYFCVGALFARYQDCLHFERWSISLLITLWGLLYVADYVTGIDPIFRLLSILLIFPLFYRMGGVNPSIGKSMRAMSIIFYMVQFVLIWLYDERCKAFLDAESDTFAVFQYSVVRFFAVLFFSIAIAWFIMRGEKKPALSFLRYLH